MGSLQCANETPTPDRRECGELDLLAKRAVARHSHYSKLINHKKIVEYYVYHFKSALSLSRLLANGLDADDVAKVMVEW